MADSSYLRKTCRLCESSDIEKVVPLEPIPLPDKFLTKDQIGKVEEEFFACDLYMCKNCKHVQILEMVNPDILWDDDFSFHSAESKGVVEHFTKVSASIIEKYKPTNESLIVDVGSNDGTLLQFFKTEGCRVLGVDPIERIAQEARDAGINTITAMFTPDVIKQIIEKEGKAAVIMAFNVFAHAHDMGAMAKSISSLLAADGIFVFEVQYLMDIVDKMLFGTIFHEHMSHHSMKSMQIFLNKYGMELIDVERVSMQGGNLLGTAQLIGGSRIPTRAVGELFELEDKKSLDKLETMNEFSSRIKQMKQMIQEILVKAKSENAIIAGYGAARSGPTLIAQLGLADFLSYIVDDHPQKVNKYTPGHNIPVVPTSEINKRKPDYVIILAWIHAQKIIDSNQEYLENGGKFIVCIPEIKIVSSEQLPIS